MKTYRTLWYCAKFFDDGKYLDDGISFYTTLVNVISLCLMLKFKLAAKAIKYRYSHCEKWLPDEYGCFILPARERTHLNYPGYAGTCYTSTLRGDAKGTCKRPAADILKHPERWHYTEHTVHDDDYDDAVEWADFQVDHNLGYNKKTIGGFFWPFRKTVIAKDEFYLYAGIPPRKNICSVFCQGFDWQAGIFPAWVIWSPIKYFLKCGVDSKPLTKA